MGFFSFLNSDPPKVDSILFAEKLNQMGYGFEQFNHESLKAMELSIDDEVRGVIKYSSGDFQDKNGFFDFVSISDFENGKREISLNKSGITEREIKNVVDFLYPFLGSDDVFRENFSASDLDDLRRDYRELPLRYWNKGKDFNISFYHHLANEFMLLEITSKIN